VRLRIAFTAAALMWPLALLLATFQASGPHSPTAMDALAVAVYAAGSVVCHQLPERSFLLWSTPMPVCARCTGIYAGAGLAAAMVVASRAVEPAAAKRNRGAVGPAVVRHTVAAAALPTLATLMIEWTAVAAPANWIRAVAGIPLGAAVAWAIGSVFAPREVN
jgi:hypothetical protein